MADLTIKVDGTIREDVTNLGKQLDIANSKKGVTANQYYNAKEDLKLMQSITSQEKITEAELKQLNSAFKRVAAVLDGASKKISNLTDAAQQKLQALNRAREEQNRIRDIKHSATSNQTKALEKYSEIVKDNNISVGRKNTVFTLDTLSNKYSTKGKLDRNTPLYDSKGNEIEGRARKDLVTEINRAIQLYQASNSSLEQASKDEITAKQNVADAEKAYKEQLENDKSSGASKDVDFIANVNDVTSSTHEHIAGMKEDVVNQKNAQAKLNSNMNLSGLSADATKATSSLGRLAKQFSIWAVGLRIARKAMSEIKTTVRDLDKSLTEQAMVTGKTRKEVYNLLGSYQNLAIQLGSTTKEVSAAVTEFIRQGKSTQEAMTLAKAAISAAKVAAINTSDSINYLTTALNGFQLSTSKAMEVSDKFAAVSANAATSYEEIAIALSKVASQANLAGMSIDYTTALLAKGLETTREAPETIGTALKTVIARMREITDYGETLEDGVDLNNVESQLAYVGIQLRNANGDLRSTEDVLDDLGKKWDTLNSNQQAAIAKALAGTRQQSRLIAMMSDYERVVELQEISARSAGATMAQMGVYTQGLEAALNKLSTSWEKIVSTVTNSDAIIFLVNAATNFLDLLNDSLHTVGGIIAAMTILGTMTVAMIASRIQEHRVQKMILGIKLEERKQSLLDLATKKKADAAEKVRLAREKLSLILEKLKTAETEKQKAVASGDLAKQASLDAEIAQLKVEEAAAMKEETAALAEQKKTDAEIATISGEIGKITAQQAINENTGLSILSKIVPVLSTILTVYYAINAAKTLGLKLSKKQNAENDKEATKNAIRTPREIMAGMVKSAGFIGAIAAIAILSALGLGIAVALGAFNNSAEEKEAKKIQDLNNEIYTLTKRAEAISTITNRVSELDNKLIKTKKDTEELSDALNQVADKLSGAKDDNIIDVGNMSEQDFYKQLNDTEKVDFLKRYQEILNERLRESDKELNSWLRNADWNNKNNRELITLSARSLAKRTSYEALDELDLTSTESSARRTMMETIIDSADDGALKDMMYDLNYMRNLLKQLGSIKTEDGSIASDVLQDENSTLKDRTEAFITLKNAFGEYSDEFIAISKAYKEFNIFADMGISVLDLIEKLNITNEELNDLYGGYSKIVKTLKEKGMAEELQQVLSEQQYKDILTGTFFESLSANNGNITIAMRESFGGILSGLENYDEAFNAILNQIGNTIQVGIQNIGQNVDKLTNSVKNFYETASKWSTMTETEKTTFLSEHGELFSGKDGERLLAAFNSQDYQQIEQALALNKTLQENRKRQLEELRAEWEVERARRGSEYNAALVTYLEQQMRELESKDFFSVDLETLVEQENKRIEAYKELLQEEQDALTKSLEERKDAYQKYFESINQAQEDEEYEEKAELFVSNLTKLAGSTSMSSKAQIEELTNSFAELEKERLNTLRERAQEAVIQNIEDSISEISEKFDELLANNRELLNLLRGTESEELLASFLTSDSFLAKTANEAQLDLNNFFATFGSQVSNIDSSQISVNDTGGNLTLNIGDQVIQLSGNEMQGRNLKDAIIAAIIQSGINVSA